MIGSYKNLMMKNLLFPNLDRSNVILNELEKNGASGILKYDIVGYMNEVSCVDNHPSHSTRRWYEDIIQTVEKGPPYDWTGPCGCNWKRVGEQMKIMETLEVKRDEEKEKIWNWMVFGWMKE